MQCFGPKHHHQVGKTLKQEKFQTNVNANLEKLLTTKMFYILILIFALPIQPYLQKPIFINIFFTSWDRIHILHADLDLGGFPIMQIHADPKHRSGVHFQLN